MWGVWVLSGAGDPDSIRVTIIIGRSSKVFPIKVRSPRVDLVSSLDIVSWPAPGEEARCRLVVEYPRGEVDRIRFRVYYRDKFLSDIEVEQGKSATVEASLTPGTHIFRLVSEETGLEKVLRHELALSMPDVHIYLDMPEEAYPGYSVSGYIVLLYKNGVYDRLDVSLMVDGSIVWKGYLARGQERRIEAKLTPGRHAILLIEESLGRVARMDATIRRVPPRVSLSLEEGVPYPNGGFARIRVDLIPAETRIAGVRVEAGEAAVDARLEEVDGRRVAVLAIRDPPPGPKIPVTLSFDLISPDGGHDVVKASIGIPVYLDKRYEEAWRRDVEVLIDKVAKASIAEVMVQARELLERCESTVSALGFDCTLIRDVVASLEKEAEELGLEAKNARRMVAEGDLVGSVPVILGLLDKCSTDRYRGIEQCQGLEELAREALAKIASKAEEEASKYNFMEVLALTRSGLELCGRNIPGSGGSCGAIERLSTTADEVHKLLSEMIRVVLPETSASRLIRGVIRITYKGNNSYKGVTVDFTPASGFVRVNPQPRVELPPILPGADLTMDLAMESLVKGRIPIPYKVCYGEYCIDQLIHTSVGTPQARVVAVASVDAYRGKSVHGLSKRKMETPKINPFPRELPIGPYTCRGLLGEGGFAAALLCMDESGVNVVLKIPLEAYRMLQETLYGSKSVLEEHRRKMERELKAFDREARILRMLNHPNIIELRGYDVDPVPYLAFEFCEYGDLMSLISRIGTLDPDTALRIMIPIADALAHGHSLEKPVLHLDVKPSNILITRTLIPKLTDYNIARVMGTVSQHSRSKTGYSPGFSPPEQFIQTLPRPGPYTDIFAHAATLYYILTGTHPYPLSEWTTGLFRDPKQVRPPSSINPEVPRELDLVLEQALKPQPHERYQDTSEYVAGLLEAHSALQY